MVPVPGGGGLVALAEQHGRILVIDPAAQTHRVALDIVSRVLDSGEKGLLSLAFAPDFGTSGLLYVSYAVADDASTSYEDIRVARYTCSRDNGLTCDRDSEEEIIAIDRPSNRDNHNGGQIFFGSNDRDLYISMGDSGGGGDPDDWAQDTTRIQGKLLRITPRTGGYDIPADNPFAGNAQGREIYAYGLRNPWRCSDDNGRIFCADVGQGEWEEVDIITRGGNYGWNKREGTHPYNGGVCATADNCIDPIHEYEHTRGRLSITGGFVYRGSTQPGLVGAYVFGDYATGEVWRLDESDGTWTATFLVNAGGGITSFGLDAAGEIYALHGDGSIRHIEYRTDAGDYVIPPTLSQTGCFADIPSQRLIAAAMPYDVRLPFWSDGAEKARYMILPNGMRASAQTSGAWSFPVGTILIKQFTYAERAIETRFYVQRASGQWRGYSYRWNDDQTDAELLEDGVTVAYGDHLHAYPSRAECDVCHTPRGGYVLGLRTEQLHIANQVSAMVDAGFVDGSALGDSATWPTLVASGSAYDVARSYLAANCSHCHNTARLPDMRLGTSLADSQLCSVITAGASTSSPIITERMSVRGEPYGTIGAGQMPPVSSFIADHEGVAAVSAWIDAMGGESLPATQSCR